MHQTMVPAGVLTYSVLAEADSRIVSFQLKKVQEPTLSRNIAEAAFQLLESLQIVSTLCSWCERLAHGA